MVSIDFGKHFYDVYLNSVFAEDITYIDSNGVETNIKAIIYREGYGDGRKFKYTPVANFRKIYVDMANSSVYGRVDVKNNSDKMRFKRNVTDSEESTFIVSGIKLVDKSKIRVEVK